MKKLLSILLSFSIIFSCVSTASAADIQLPTLENIISFDAGNAVPEGEVTVPETSDDEDISETSEQVDFDTFSSKVTELINDYEDEGELTLSGEAPLYYGSSSYESLVQEEAECTNRLIVKSAREIDTLNAVDYVCGFDDLYILQFANYDDYTAAYNYYLTLDYVEYVQEDGVYSETEVVENNAPFTESAVGLSTQYQSDYFGYTDAKANMGTCQVVIAVIDSGVQHDHERLQGRVIPTGFDSINNESCYDTRGHGTHVAGIIAANTKSNVIIKPYKVLDDSGQGTDTQVYLGVQAAIEDGVDIINLSMSKRGDSELLREVIKEAYDAGITIVAAAGNNNENVSTTIYTPASFEEVICVVSIDTTRYKADTSNWGSTKDLSAPGVNILSTHLDNTYKVMSGTSMAAPFISSAAAYLLADDSTLTPEEVYSTLYASTTRGGGTHNIRYVVPGALVRSTVTCATPVFAPEPAEFAGWLNVELTCSTSGAEILYRTSDMADSTWLSYTGPVKIEETETMYAYAICAGYKNSGTSTATYPKSSIDASQFQVDENGILTGYTGTSVIVNVPQYCNGSVVTGVSASAFSGNRDVETVTFSKYVVDMEEGAFAGCTSLISVFAPSVTTLDSTTFAGCENLQMLDLSAVTDIPAELFKDFTSLRSVSFSALKTIGDRAFYGCTSLQSVSAPSLTSIGDSAFENSSVTSVTAGNVTSIGNRAFHSSGIKSVSFPYASFVGKNAFAYCENLTGVTLTYLKELGESVFEGSTALKNVNINSVEIIPAYTFYDCNALATVTAGNATSIGQYAFGNTALTKLTLAKVGALSENAFYNCKSLTSVTMAKLLKFNPDQFFGCENIESFTFAGLTTLDVGYNQISNYFPLLETFKAVNYAGEIPDYAFTGCSNLSTFSFAKVTSIGAYAFKGTALTEIDAPLVETLSSGAFNDIVALKTVKMAKLGNFGPYYFSGCTNVETMTFGSAELAAGYKMVDYLPNLKTFSAGVALRVPAEYFKDHRSINKVYMSSAVEIGAEAFCNSTITEPNFNATTLGERAFADCDNLVYVDLPKAPMIDMAIFEGSEESVLEIGFNGMSNITEEDFDTFNFSKFTNLELINIQNVPVIPKGAFKGCTKLDEIYMDKVTHICEEAFMNCESLITLSIPLVTEIETGAFRNCTGLQKFSANSLQTFKPDMLEGCTSLENLSLNSVLFMPTDENGSFALKGVDNLKSFSANAVTAVPANFLRGYRNLTSVSFNNAKTIGNYAFCDTGITEFAFGEKLLTIGKYSFANTPLTLIDLGAVEYVGDYAFSGCTQLADVVGYPDSIGEYAFKDCTALEIVELYYTMTPDNMPANAFDGCVNIRNLGLYGVESLYDESGVSYVADKPQLVFFGANSVESIPDNYFAENPNLTEVEMNNVTEIGNGAFENTKLSEFDGSLIEKVGEYAFFGTKLTYLSLPVCRTVGKYAFADCQDLTQATFDYNVKLSEGAFQNCTMLTTVSLPGSQAIPDKCFKNCYSLNELNNGNSTRFTVNFTALGKEAFYDCQAFSLTEFDFTNLQSMGTDCLKGTFIDELNQSSSNDYVMPKLKVIEDGAFNGIVMYSLAMENVEMIGDLPECEYVVIGSDVKDFYPEAYEGIVFAPEYTCVGDYCEELGIEYRRLNATEAFLNDVPQAGVNHESEISFEPVGFDLTYQWYACNEDDRSDSVILANQTQNTFIPADALTQTNDEFKYRYYYCIATSVENGNVLEIRSGLCANAHVKILCTEATVVDFGDKLIYTHSSENINSTSGVFTELGENIVVKPSYSSGETMLYGTGTKVKVYGDVDHIDLMQEYTIVVYGDVNGDSVVDALDAQIIARQVNGLGEIGDKTTRRAADLDKSYEIDVNDYQAVVNKVVA